MQERFLLLMVLVDRHLVLGILSHTFTTYGSLLPLSILSLRQLSEESNISQDQYLLMLDSGIEEAFDLSQNPILEHLSEFYYHRCRCQVLVLIWPWVILLNLFFVLCRYCKLKP